MFWLVKSESSAYSIDDLKREKTTPWGGVRNYQARNYLRSMKKGEKVLYYHSVDDPIGVVGVAGVDREAEPDMTQFESKSEYFDPKATLENPIWFCPMLRFEEKFPRILSREMLKNEKMLHQMVLLQKASRLSVQPVTDEEFRHILKISRQ